MVNRIFILAGLILFSSTTLNADPVWRTYQSANSSHYENGKIAVRNYGNQIEFSAVHSESGHSSEVEAQLWPESENIYRGSGIIKVRYGGGYGCNHRFGIKLYFDGQNILIRENTPQSIPYEPNSGCRAAGPYVWYNHAGPYVPVEE